MGGQLEYPNSIAGVDPASLRMLNVEMGSKAQYLTQRLLLEAELEAKLEEVRAEFQPALEEITENIRLLDERMTTTFFHDLMPVAEDADALRSIQLPNGVLVWRKAPSETITITNERVFLESCRKLGVLKQVSEWRRTILKEMIEQLLKRQPELRGEIEGMLISRSYTLATRLHGKYIPSHKQSDVQETVL